MMKINGINMMFYILFFLLCQVMKMCNFSFVCFKSTLDVDFLDALQRKENNLPNMMSSSSDLRTNGTEGTRRRASLTTQFRYGMLDRSSEVTGRSESPGKCK